MKKEKLYIVVENGFVSEVYSSISSAKLDVEILDFDGIEENSMAQNLLRQEYSSAKEQLQRLV